MRHLLSERTTHTLPFSLRFSNKLNWILCVSCRTFNTLSHANRRMVGCVYIQYIYSRCCWLYQTRFSFIEQHPQRGYKNNMMRSCSVDCINLSWSVENDSAIGNHRPCDTEAVSDKLRPRLAKILCRVLLPGQLYRVPRERAAPKESQGVHTLGTERKRCSSLCHCGM